MKNFIKLFFIIFLMTIASDAKLTKSNSGIAVDYIVKNGDTLYTIAHRHHTTVKELREANNLNLRSVIKVGESLRVPLNTYFPDGKKAIEPVTIESVMAASTGSDGTTVNYRVQSGDTFFSIARAHHTSIAALLKANNMNMHSIIKVGKNLVVPVNTYFPKKNIVSQPSVPKKVVKTVKSPAQTSTEKGRYIVQSGDNLFSIARKNHIAISELMKLNNIGLGDSLKVGQALLVSKRSSYIAGKKVLPKKPKVEQKKKLPIGAMPSYTVKKGDTLWKIARKHHLTLAQIRKLNKMRKKDRIHTGMVLAVGKAVRPTPKTYKVKKGDTLWLIAKKNKMSTKQLRKLNHMRKKDRIHTGMVLALAKGVRLPSKKEKEKTIIAKLKRRGAKKDDIAAVLAKIKKGKSKNPDIMAVLAQVKKEKKRRVETPLRISKKRKTKSKKSRFSSAASILNGGSSKRSSWFGGGNSKVIRTAKRYLGRRYVWGAVGPRSFDCSGFTQYVMRKSKGVRLPRVSRKQAYYGKYVSRSHLRAGDLIFFDTSRRRRGYVNHVGIYLGNNKFIHASSARHRVVITSLNRPFYKARFKWGRRVN